uniref:Uncharacterized protein n=1 Tax=Rhizophora mucronata TaxID=61149 RepID=A0A2P2NCH5_RHIMU
MMASLFRCVVPE